MEEWVGRVIGWEDEVLQVHVNERMTAAAECGIAAASAQGLGIHTVSMVTTLCVCEWMVVCLFL